MSRHWGIDKAIKAVDGYEAFTALYDHWFQTYYEGDSEEYIGFHHYVQMSNPEKYQQYRAYARLMGWVV